MVNDLPVAIVEVVNAPTQEVVIDARGPDVLNISGNVEKPDDPDAIMPDWVELIVKAANLGMMSGMARPPWSSRATLAKKIFDRTNARMQWTLALDQVDPGMFLVILTVLCARRLDGVSIQTVTAPLDARRLDVKSLTYPAHYRDVPFEVRRKEPLRTTRDRMLQVEFAHTPGDELQKLVASAFEVWTELLILGGYAPPGQDPRLVHTLPEFAYWLDDVTFVQAFEESFESDEACFEAMVGWAARMHHQGTAVRSVTIV
jgi:hypothetical protein